MSTIALLYDVHGNLPALEAVLDDAAGGGAERYVLGGDYALFGAWPRETVLRLRNLPQAVWIRGNAERWTGDPTQAPDGDPVQGAIAACRDQLGEQLVAELAQLAFTVAIDGTRCCHASPLSDVRSFAPEPGDDETELLADVGERRLIFGHTHLPFRRIGVAGIELINPGSVGMPFDGDPRASYALLSGDAVEHRRVAYDHRASAQALRERWPEGWADTVAQRIERAAP